MNLGRDLRDFPPDPAQEKKAPRVRLDFLDGLRGLAALYVVFNHVWITQRLNWNTRTDTGHEVDPGLPHRLGHALQLLKYGHYAVVVFIVLSGFCLMLPLVRSSDGALKGWFLGYLKRRSLRILPPYYAALGLSLLLILLVPGLHRYDNCWWSISLPALTTGTIVSHLLLVHNLNSHWMLKINAPMWSVAVEWQIYFIFPLLLLPVWKRFGSAAAVAVGFALGMALEEGLHQRLHEASPWFIGSFALGMAAASVCFSRRKSEVVLRERAPWGVLSLVCALGIAVVVRRQGWAYGQTWPIDIGISLCAALFLVYCTRLAAAQPLQKRSWWLRLLEARGSQHLGTFSYSLYLTHFPILGLLDLWFRMCHVTPVVHLMLLVFVAVPVCVLSAYVFYFAVERHFVPHHSSAPRPPVALRPAPALPRETLPNSGAAAGFTEAGSAGAQSGG